MTISKPISNIGMPTRTNFSKHGFLSYASSMRLILLKPSASMIWLRRCSSTRESVKTLIAYGACLTVPMPAKLTLCCCLCTATSCLPPLGNAEHTLLNKHDGCTRCWYFYVGCCSQSCPNGFPVGKGYGCLTLTDLLAAKKAKAVAKTFAVTSKIEALSSNKEIATATAVLPDSPGNFESDLENYDDPSDHDVSALLYTKHLFWTCQLHKCKQSLGCTKNHLRQTAE